MLATMLSKELNTLPIAIRERLSNIVLADSFAGTIDAGIAQDLCAEQSLSIDELMLMLLPLARSFAHPSISDFYVGAVARGASENLIFGANMEFQGLALNATVHAEQAAVFYAHQQGETGIDAIAVNNSPCGHCRQFLLELNNPDLRVITPQIGTKFIGELLPGAFTPVSLGNHDGLLTKQHHGLSLDSPVEPITADAEVVDAALNAANRSYAPYSKNWASVAVCTTGNRIVAAPYIENVAYNPSLSPLQGALITMRMQQLSWSDIEHIVFVEKEGHGCSQKLATESLLNVLDLPHLCPMTTIIL